MANAGAELRIENTSIIELDFKRHDNCYAQCPNKRCSLNQRFFESNITDNARVPCALGAYTTKRVLVKRLSTAKEVLEENMKTKKDVSVEPIEIHAICKNCDYLCERILANDTPEHLYLDLQRVLINVKSQQLLFKEPDAIVKMPDDAYKMCAITLQFPEIHPGVVNLIETSLKRGALKDKLDQKKELARSRFGDEKLSYIRIGLGWQWWGNVTGVLELWPANHKSPKHQHGGCAGSVRVLTGEVQMQVYRSLFDEKPITFQREDYGLELRDPTDVLKMQAGQTTWLNRENFFVHQVISPNNIRGFNLSLHLYKSCTDEFAFEISDGKVKSAAKSNPNNDFFWNIDLPSDDWRIKDEKASPSFVEHVLDKKEFGIFNIGGTNYLKAVKWSEEIPFVDNVWRNSVRRVLGRKEDDKDIVLTRRQQRMKVFQLKRLFDQEFKDKFPIRMQVEADASADNARKAALRAELEELRTGAVRRRAKEEYGIGDNALEEGDDAPNPKAAFIEMILTTTDVNRDQAMERPR